MLALLAVELSAAAGTDQRCNAEPAKLRYDDSLECASESSTRRGLAGAFSHFPLNEGSNASVRFGGEVRQRYEYTHDPSFGGDPKDDGGVWLQRYTLHTDLRLGPRFRFFGQLSSALETGREGGPSPVDENELTLQNAFADLSLALTEESDLTLRVGRQELQYGSGRLVDVREGPNVRRTFDAARVMLELPDWRIDALAARPQVSQPGVFDDEESDQHSLWGVYAVGGGKLVPFGQLDLYYLGFRDEAGSFVQGTANERRDSLGARLWGSESGWDWNWEAIYQFGSFGRGDLSAWTLASETGFTFAGSMWRPRIALSANIASGDDDSTDQHLGTFNPLYPRGNYFSEAAVVGPRNFFNLHPFVTIRPDEAWSVTADVNFFWRLETEDGVYAPSGQLIREPNGSKKRFVGSTVSLTSAHELVSNLTFTAIYTHFFAGEFIRETGPSEDIDFLEFTVHLKF